jgi:hypothetical protein
MIESLLSLLVYLLIIGLLLWGLRLVLGLFGVAIPQNVLQIVGIIVLVLVLLMFFGGYIQPIALRR